MTEHFSDLWENYKSKVIWNGIYVLAVIIFSVFLFLFNQELLELTKSETNVVKSTLLILSYKNHLAIIYFVITMLLFTAGIFMIFIERQDFVEVKTSVLWFIYLAIAIKVILLIVLFWLIQNPILRAILIAIFAFVALVGSSN